MIAFSLREQQNVVSDMKCGACPITRRVYYNGYSHLQESVGQMVLAPKGYELAESPEWEFDCHECVCYSGAFHRQAEANQPHEWAISM